MNVELTPGLCIDVAEALRLPHPGLVEKDYHVVRALQALSEVEHAGARLVFGGGTSLCRAYRLIERMSEDIDLRVASDQPLTDGGRRKFRAAVSKSLIAAGFEFDPENRDHLAVHDSGRTLVYHLPYVQGTTSVASLRAGVKVEISSWPLLRAKRGVVLRRRSNRSGSRGQQHPLCGRDRNRGRQVCRSDASHCGRTIQTGSTTVRCYATSTTCTAFGRTLRWTRCGH